MVMLTLFDENGFIHAVMFVCDYWPWPGPSMQLRKTYITTSHITLISWIHIQCCTNTYHWLVKKTTMENAKKDCTLCVVMLCDVREEKNKTRMMKAVIKGCGTILFMTFCCTKPNHHHDRPAAAKKNKFYFCTARSLGAQQSSQ